MSDFDVKEKRFEEDIEEYLIVKQRIESGIKIKLFSEKVSP